MITNRFFGIDAESTYKKYGFSAKDGAIEIETAPVKEDYKRTVYKNKDKDKRILKSLINGVS